MLGQHRLLFAALLTVLLASATLGVGLILYDRIEQPYLVGQSGGSNSACLTPYEHRQVRMKYPYRDGWPIHVWGDANFDLRVHADRRVTHVEHCLGLPLRTTFADSVRVWYRWPETKESIAGSVANVWNENTTPPMPEELTWIVLSNPEFAPTVGPPFQGVGGRDWLVYHRPTLWCLAFLGAGMGLLIPSAALASVLGYRAWARHAANNAATTVPIPAK